MKIEEMSTELKSELEAVESKLEFFHKLKGLVSNVTYGCWFDGNEYPSPQDFASDCDELRHYIRTSYLFSDEEMSSHIDNLERLKDAYSTAYSIMLSVLRKTLSKFEIVAEDGLALASSELRLFKRKHAIGEYDPAWVVR